MNTTTQQKSLSIYDIKRLTGETSPYFFVPKTMRFFGQTLRSFSVRKQSDGRYYISAPMIDRTTGRVMGKTERYFNPITNELEHKDLYKYLGGGRPEQGTITNVMAWFAAEEVCRMFDR